MDIAGQPLFVPRIRTDNSAKYPFGSSVITGFAASQVANPDLKWETSVQTNIGLDYGFKDNTFTGTIATTFKNKAYDTRIELQHEPIAGWRGVLGTWRSTSGNSFVIADRGRSFHIILTDVNGRKSILNASWIPGMEGTQFTYQNGPVRATITRMPSDNDQVRVESSDGKVNTWTRVN